LCDPQTSGGLLIAVEPQGQQALEALLQAEGLQVEIIGELVAGESDNWVEVL